MSVWLYWALAAFGPTIVVIILGSRAARLGTETASYDLGDAGHVFSWMMPGLVVLAGLIPPASPGWLGALRYVLPLTIFPVVFTLFSVSLFARKTGYTSDSRRSMLGMILYGSGSAFAIAIFILAVALFRTGPWALEPSTLLFAKLTFAGYIGRCIGSNLGFRKAKWEYLAPCELASRAAEIGKQAGVEVREVRILRNMPLRWVSALAYSESSIGLTEELVLYLNKDEVDIVIAHETGHCADRKYWDDTTPVAYVAILAGFLIAAVAEAKINMLHQSFHWLNYVLWMCLFLIPPLVWRWYSRRVERNADKYQSMLGKTRAVISAHYKLGVLNNTPLSRRWWSRILSTHPSLEEIITKDARASGITDTELDDIIRTAQAELDQGSGEKYQLEYHQEACEEVEKRPENRWWPYKTIQTAAIFIGVTAILFLIVLFDGVVEYTYMPYIIAGSIVVGAFIMILPPVVYKMIAYQRLRLKINTMLKAKYAELDIDDSLLVDALFVQDWDESRWQVALLGFRNGKLLLLGETRQVEVDLKSSIALQEGSEYKSFGLERKASVVCYEVDGAQQWFAIRPFGRAGKGRPNNLKQLEKYLRSELASAGVNLPDRPELTNKQKMAYVTRTLIAGVLAAAVIWIVELLSRIEELGCWLENSMTFIFIYGVLIPALLGWISRAPKSVKVDDKETAAKDE